MTKYYEEITNARLVICAEDATYTVEFSREWLKGKTWEFDPMSDAVGQWETKRTDKIRIRFIPVKDTMAFPEDANRPLSYVMSIEDARNFWKFMRKSVHFWFALDMANQGELHGFDADLLQSMENCVGCAFDVKPVDNTYTVFLDGKRVEKEIDSFSDALEAWETGQLVGLEAPNYIKTEEEAHVAYNVGLLDEEELMSFLAKF